MQVQTFEQLHQDKCKPCEGGVEACSIEQAQQQLQPLDQWQLSDDGKMISRRVKRKNFMDAMRLLQQVAEVAEQQQHHPDLHLTGYRQVRIDLTTHAIGGLSENDFIVAAKIDALIDGEAR